MNNRLNTCLVSLLLLAATVARAEEAAMAAALKAIEASDSQQAVALLDAVISKEPKLATAYYWRGSEQFRLGDMEKSLADFDRFIELEPKAASSQWKRGIVCYYAKKYELGAKQFELYQTYHDQDVENSVWRYLCVVPSEGVEKARENMLPIENDRRVPMMEIYEMFRGNKSPDDVFSAAKAGNPSEETLKPRMFYAHLYVGLYYESLGKPELARPHIQAAAGKYRISHYMGDVAHVHAAQMPKAAKSEAK